MEIKFRRAAIGDFKTISMHRKQVHDYHSYQKPEFYKNVESPLEKTEFEELLAGNASSIYVVESGEIIYGYVITKIICFRGNPLIVDHKRLFIEDIFVDPRFRKMGMGKFLLENLESVCRSEGYSHLDLNVWSFNKDAIAFYKKIGMRESILRMEKPIDL